ncbi:MAG: ABC transporter permease subunit, partial [Thermoplasmata archaeon]
MSALNAVFRRFGRFAKSRRFQLSAGIISVSAFIIFWHGFAWLFRYWDWDFQEYVPFPVDVFTVLVDSFVHEVPGMDMSMGVMAFASFKRVVIGFTLALVVAFPLGLLMASFRFVNYLGDPIIEMFRPIPPVAWIPVFLVMLSVFWGPVAIVFLGAFFPILLNVMFGVKRTDQTLIDAAKTLGARRVDIFTKVVIPSTAPYLMTGVKVGLGISWMCIVAAEMLPVLGGGVGSALWTS